MPDNKAQPMSSVWVPMRIAARYALAAQVDGVVLTDMFGKSLPAFAPGAHLKIKVPGGIRSYSLCNLPEARDHYLLAIRHSPSSRGGARYLCEECNVGDTLEVCGPRNNFSLSPMHKSVVLIAGGIGITPIISMADQLAQQDVEFELHYSARSRAEAAFVDRLNNSPYRDRVRFHLRGEPGFERLDLEAIISGLAANQHVYLCGPQAMVDHAHTLAQRVGLRDRLHIERFGASDVPPVADSAEGGFEVIAARSGLRIEIPADCSIAAALQAHGVDVPLSCEQGICGMCQLDVLDGTPDHRDEFLSDEQRAAGDSILPCVSRARTATLTLNI